MIYHDIIDPRWVNYIFLQWLYDRHSWGNKWLNCSKFTGEMAKIKFKVRKSPDTWIGWVSQGLIWSFKRVNLLVFWAFKRSWTLLTSASIKAVSTTSKLFMHPQETGSIKNWMINQSGFLIWGLFLYTDWWSSPIELQQLLTKILTNFSLSHNLYVHIILKAY